MRFRRYLRLRGDPQREAADELASHIEMKVEQLLRAGLSRSAAEREARAQFGDRARIEREVLELVQSRESRERRADWLDAARQDVRFALRQLGATPGFALVAILTIGLGIGANTAIFSVVRAALLRPLPYDGADRIVLIGETETPAHPDARETTSYPTYEAWKVRARSFEAMGLFDAWGPTLTGLGDAERLNGSLLTSGVFDVFRIQPALGRPMLPADNVVNGPAIVWISWSFWQTRFAGAPDVIGRAITLNGRPHEVVGVLPRDFIAPGDELDTEVWSPTWYDERDSATARYLNVVARLKPAVTLAEARSEMSAITRQLQQEQPQVYSGQHASVVPLRELVIGSRTREPLVLLLLASIVVLLIACANTSNLLIARGSYRAKEFAIRSALGTTRARLFRQLITESAVLAVIGGGIGLGLAALGVRVLMGLAPAAIQAQQVRVDSTVLGFAMLSALGSAFVVGVLPALRAGRVDVQHMLREEGRGSTSSRQRVRGALAVIQLSLALSLVLSAGLLIKSYARMLQVDPGLEPNDRLSLYLSLPAAKYQQEAMPRFYEAAVNRVRAAPGVVDAAMTSIVPFSGGWDRIAVDTGSAKLPGSQLPEADRYIVSPSYFRTMGIPLKRGRGFEASDRDGPPVAVVDEVFARKVARDGNALGVRIGVPGRDSAATIVGIVGHVKHYGLDAESGGQVYISHVQYPWRWLYLVVHADGDPVALVPTVRQAIRSLDAALPISELKTIQAHMADRTAGRRFTLTLLGVFAALALTLASVGLYGVISYATAQRQREFGIRLALGASPGMVVRMVLREGGGLVVSGLVIGLALAVAGTRLLESLLFGVSALDPLVLAGAAAFLAGTAAFAAWLPARRAASADPLEVLAAR